MKKIARTLDIKTQFIRPELSIQECRLILCEDGEEFTDKEIEKIRDFILNLVEIHYINYKSKQILKSEEAKVIDIKNDSASENNFKETG